MSDINADAFSHCAMPPMVALRYVPARACTRGTKARVEGAVRMDRPGGCVPLFVRVGVPIGGPGASMEG